MAALSSLLALGDREATSPAGHMRGQAAACCPAVRPLFPLLPKGPGAQEGHGTESHLLREKLDPL